MSLRYKWGAHTTTPMRLKTDSCFASSMVGAYRGCPSPTGGCRSVQVQRSTPFYTYSTIKQRILSSSPTCQAPITPVTVASMTLSAQLSLLPLTPTALQSRPP